MSVKGSSEPSIERALLNLKEYINYDDLYQKYLKKGNEVIGSDFDLFDISHCRDIDILMQAFILLSKKYVAKEDIGVIWDEFIDCLEDIRNETYGKMVKLIHKRIEVDKEDIGYRKEVAFVEGQIYMIELILDEIKDGEENEK